MVASDMYPGRGFPMSSIMARLTSCVQQYFAAGANPTLPGEEAIQARSEKVIMEAGANYSPGADPAERDSLGWGGASPRPYSAGW